MEALSNNNKETSPNFNILKTDPVITYDHMSEKIQKRYFGLKQTRETNSIVHFLLEEILIAGLFALALYTCL